MWTRCPSWRARFVKKNHTVKLIVIKVGNGSPKKLFKLDFSNNMCQVVEEDVDHVAVVGEEKEEEEETRVSIF